MKTYVDKETFVNAFDRFGRSEQFTRAAREALFEYYEELEEGLGEEIEFDCIAICCDWSEYNNYTEAGKDYFSKDQYDAMVVDCDENWGEIDTDLLFKEYFDDNTQVVEFEGGILVQAF